MLIINEDHRYDFHKLSNMTDSVSKVSNSRD